MGIIIKIKLVKILRTALLISGYLRTFKLNLLSLKEKISILGEVDIFLHITKNESLEDKYLNNIKIEDINIIKNELNPKVVLEENNLIYSFNKEINIIFNTWSKYYKLNNLKKEYENIFGKYDIVIKYRPDTNFISDISIEDIEKKTIYIPNDSKIDHSKLKNRDDKYICDIFAYGDSESMDQYFLIFEQIEKLTNKYGHVPETILYYYLNDNDIKYIEKDIKFNVILSSCNIFAICGDSGSGKSTLGNLLKKYFSNSFILECDRYHKWERKNENWNNFTHLNPEANLISKMNSDIFDLKIGKTIYHVDYDHSTGEFTDKKLVNSTDNIIVCGLHSLYNSDNLYNLKIYMDTDPKLKIKWKIERDSKERGHSLDYVLDQIENRKKDYYKYILPQKEKSDIIINFFTNDINSNNIYLKLLINKKYEITNILRHFSKNKIVFEINFENELFNEITFLEFKYCEYLNFYKLNLNNYYDYIMFFILSLK